MKVDVCVSYLRAFLLKRVIFAFWRWTQVTLGVLARLRVLMLFACLCVVPAYGAGPSGGVVSAGSATITQSAAQTTIKQSSDKAVINWGNFSIGSGSSVRFVQPSASSIALNRVTGSQASVIQGALQANGQVWVLNPNGVLIAPGGQVATGSFLGTTRSLTDQQFMAGNYAFTDGGVPGASVVNQGSIIVAEGGYAVLAGEAVRNEGYIEANLGQVVLGGAKAFTLDLSGDNTLAFVVTAPVDVTPTDGKAVVDNSGSIQAAGGRVLMTARAASQVVGQVINTGGVVAATSAQMVNGKIVLDGGSGSVSVAGDLNASGKGTGQSGGAIDVNAQNIQVKATAKLDVSGDVGGGKIAIGGGGANTRTQSFTPAASTTIASGAHLDASALTRGDGGEIIIFTSLTNPSALTQVAGSLIARGGAQGGNGGFIETSGYRLDVEGIIVNASAPQGRRGLWLLDPDNIIINTGPDSPVGCAITDCSTVTASSLGTMLSGGTDVMLTATGSIYVISSLTWGAVTGYGSSASPSYYPTLTLKAGNVIDFYPGSTIKGRGHLIMTAGGNVSVDNILIDYWSDPTKGSVTITAGGSLAVRQAIQSSNVSLRAQTLNIDNIVGVTGVVGSSVSISDATTVNINKALIGNTISVAAPGGTIKVAADLTSTTSATLNAANVTFSEIGTAAGALNVTATTAITLEKNYTAIGATVFTAPTVNWNAGWSGANTELKTNTVNWGAAGAYTGSNGPVLTVGASSAGTTTFNLSGALTLQALRIEINNPLAWSTHELTLQGTQTFLGKAAEGVAVNASLTGTNGAKLVIANFFAATGGAQTISLTGTPAKPSTFTLGVGAPQTEGTEKYAAGVSEKTVVIDNSGGSSGGSGSGEAAVVITPVVTPASTTTATTAADAATAKAIADAAAAKAAELDSTTKVIVDQAVSQAVATVVASTSAAVFVAPAPPPATTTTSSASTTTSTDTTAASSSTSTTTAATTTTATATTVTTTTATTGAPSTGQSTTVTQEFVEPLTVATLSSTTSTVSDPGDASAATTSATSGPASQTATPASTASAAPAAPALTPVAVSKDGADAADFTLQTVKPPAPVTAAKQEARPTERTTNTPVSPGIALQATQKVPAPSGSVLGREISGSGNSSNW